MTNLADSKKRIHLFGVEIDLYSMDETVGIIRKWVARPENLCKFVVTPNVDHIVKVQTDIGLQASYRQAALVVTDGKPVVWAASFLGIDIPGTVPGSDLVPAIFDSARVRKKANKSFFARCHAWCCRSCQRKYSSKMAIDRSCRYIKS